MTPLNLDLKPSVEWLEEFEESEHEHQDTEEQRQTLGKATGHCLNPRPFRGIQTRVDRRVCLLIHSIDRHACLTSRWISWERARTPIRAHGSWKSRNAFFTLREFAPRGRRKSCPSLTWPKPRFTGISRARMPSCSLTSTEVLKRFGTICRVLSL